MLEVFRVNEIGEPTILRPLSADEAHTDVFKSRRSRSHYNSLLFLHKNGCVSIDLCPQVDELLEQMESTIKTFASLRVAPMTDRATRRLTFPSYANATDSDEELQSVSKNHWTPEIQKIFSRNWQ